MKKSVIAKILAGTTLVFSSLSFAAEGDSPAKAAFDSLTKDATEMTGYAWLLTVSIVGATVGIKLFKKFVNRAS